MYGPFKKRYFKFENLYRATKSLLPSIYFMPENSVYPLWAPHLKKKYCNLKTPLSVYSY